MKTESRILGIPFFAHGNGMQFCIYEDDLHPQFAPLVHFRPVFDLRCGFRTLRERLAAALPPGASLRCIVRTALEPLLPELQLRAYGQSRPDNVILVNGRAIADARLRTLLAGKLPPDTVYRNDRDVIVASLTAASLAKLRRDGNGAIKHSAFDTFSAKTISTTTVHYPWDLIMRAGAEIERETEEFRSGAPRMSGSRRAPGVHLVRPSAIGIGADTVLSPGVVLDASDGPILIGRGVRIMPNAVIEGPAAIGDGTLIKIGAKIYAGTAIGEYCKIGGEVESSTIQSYANKQHDGFLGHSYLASWVNLGADTNTSDLKNTYGRVSVELNGKPFDTGLQFLGLIAGDHTKTGINAMFNTGTIVGAACNLYGAELPPKYVPSFSWGSGGDLVTHKAAKALATARIVMARRRVTLSDAYERHFLRLFEETRRDRKRAGVR